ncbi:S41 family peptidase [Pedobacter psychrodurus]|uniref:S41 family peptidase n=1 Tax=Pedobacter psychrodurus TaxID=2530456 RepID=UPI00292E1B00|nr:S41 family peptidase [Pedobacter psychrodurus]
MFILINFVNNPKLMKTQNFCIFILCPLIFSVITSCNPDREGKFVASNVQFINPGFEQKTDANLPADWALVPTTGYTVSQVNDVKNQGAYALKIEGKPNDASTYINVKQKLPVDYKKVKRIRIAAYIKTEQLKGNVVLWCQIWDAKNNQIGFENSESLGIIATGTKDWQKHAMEIIVNKDAKYLVFGTYIRGQGTVWLDDFAVEEYEGATAKPSPEVAKLNQEFIDIVKQNSIYKDSVNWKALDEDLVLLGKGLKTTHDARILNNYVLQQLKKAGDNHSFIQNNIAAENYASGNSIQTKPEAKLLANGIGYISVPAYASVNEKLGEEFALTIQNLIRNLDTKNNINGWIVDLRTNSGGNMYPMISGLAPLLDVGNLGYFVKGGVSSPWQLTENGMGVMVKNPYKIKNKNNKIAVLINSNTGSSGEMTAVSFIGQQNTKLFGEPTGGYITGNQAFKLSDGSNLLLATSYTADRNHKKYLERVYPDVMVKTLADQDAALQTAKSWLETK